MLVKWKILDSCHSRVFNCVHGLSKQSRDSMKNQHQIALYQEPRTLRTAIFLRPNLSSTQFGKSIRNQHSQQITCLSLPSIPCGLNISLSNQFWTLPLFICSMVMHLWLERRCHILLTKTTHCRTWRSQIVNPKKKVEVGKLGCEIYTTSDLYHSLISFATALPYSKTNVHTRNCPLKTKSCWL